MERAAKYQYRRRPQGFMGHEAVASISRENWKRLRNSNDRRQLFEGFDVHVCGAPETPLYGIDSWKNLQLMKRVDMQALHPCWGKVFSLLDTRAPSLIQV